MSVLVDHSAAKVIAADRSDDAIEVIVRNGEELYFRVVSGDSGESSVVVVLNSVDTRQLLEGIVEVLRSQL